MRNHYFIHLDEGKWQVDFDVDVPAAHVHLPTVFEHISNAPVAVHRHCVKCLGSNLAPELAELIIAQKIQKPRG